jgi:hypothetical protein
MSDAADFTVAPQEELQPWAEEMLKEQEEAKPQEADAQQQDPAASDVILFQVPALSSGDAQGLADILLAHPELYEQILATAAGFLGNDTVAKALELINAPQAQPEEPKQEEQTPPDVIEAQAAEETAAGKPEAIYFGGVTADGGARILKAAVAAGMADIPFVGPDGIYDGSSQTPDSFLNLAGDDAKNSVATAAAVGDFPGREEFAARFKAEYGTDPTGYSATGYACAQVVIDALNRAAAATDMKTLRENVRVAAVDTTVKYTSVIGEFTFDENGDTSQKIISFYGYDAATKDWAFKSQLDFAK